MAALDVASSAPSRVRVPRVGALESPQPGLPSRGGGGSRTRDAATKQAPEAEPPQRCLWPRARSLAVGTGSQAFAHDPCAPPEDMTDVTHGLILWCSRTVATRRSSLFSARETKSWTHAL